MQIDKLGWIPMVLPLPIIRLPPGECTSKGDGIDTV